SRRKKNMTSDGQNTFDLSYIASQIGLVRVGDRLINTAAIVAILPSALTMRDLEDKPSWRISLSNEMGFNFSDDEMAEFQRAIAAKREDSKREQLEAMEFQIRAQFEIQERITREQMGKANKGAILIPELVPKGRGRA